MLLTRTSANDRWRGGWSWQRAREDSRDIAFRVFPDTGSGEIRFLLIASLRIRPYPGTVMPGALFTNRVTVQVRVLPGGGV